MKKLIIVAHPNIQESVINKRWVEELAKHKEEFEIHNIYAAYPNWTIDVEKEHKLLEAHDTIVFQFPFYWFNCTPLLKKYLDDVFTYGWAYGSTGDKLKGKTFALAVSTGSATSDYSHTGKAKLTLDELLRPMQASAVFVGMNYKGLFTQGGCLTITPEEVDKSAKNYVEFLKGL